MRLSITVRFSVSIFPAPTLLAPGAQGFEFKTSTFKTSAFETSAFKTSAFKTLRSPRPLMAAGREPHDRPTL